MNSSNSPKLKILLIISIFIFSSAQIVVGQSLQKGNLLGMHTVTITLSPDASLNQYKNFLTSKFFPALQKNVGMSAYLLEGVRGEDEGKIGFLMFFKSDAERNKYFTEDGSPNENWNAAMAKMQDVVNEGNALGSWTSTYTDWVIK